MSDISHTVLAISGSLRAGSLNTAVLEAAQKLAPPPMRVILWPGLAGLPAFNPDLDAAPPPAVAAWRNDVSQADCLLFCSPEYAHGVPGALKNALDWLVSHEGFVNKRVAVIDARPAEFAPAMLRETLRVMNARILDRAGVALGLTSNALDADALLDREPVRRALERCLREISHAD